MTSDADPREDAAARPAGRRRRVRSRAVSWRDLRAQVRPEVQWFLLPVVAGIPLGVLWRVLAVDVARGGNPLEQEIAVDGTLALLGLAAGVVTGVAVLLRPGARPLIRTVVVIAGTLVGAATCWAAGELSGEPPLRAPGAALTWPLTAAAVLFAGALLPGTSRAIARADESGDDDQGDATDGTDDEAAGRAPAGDDDQGDAAGRGTVRDGRWERSAHP